jgi:thiol:disulfide interchange protein DsbC
MKKLAYLSIALLLFSCGAKQQNVISDNASAKIIKEIIKPLKARGVELEKIEKTNREFVKGFKTYRVKLFDKKNSRHIYRYIWLSEDNKYFTFQILKAEFVNGTLKVTPIEPEKNVELAKVDLSWLSKIVDELKSNGIPYTIGKGNKTVYIVWDIYCPFCYSHFKEVVGKKIQELNVTLKMIPLPVHGKSSMEGFVYFTDMAQKLGLKAAMEKIFEKGNGDFVKYAKEFSNEVNKNYKKIPETKRKKLEEFYRKLSEELTSHNIHATPTIIYIPPEEKNKGFITVGFIPLEQVVKMR